MKKLLGALALLVVLFSGDDASALSCKWQGGTGVWNNANTASWSCGVVPGQFDDVVFDGTSGGGTVSVCSASVNAAACPNGSALVQMQSITAGAFTGTIDFSINNPRVDVTSGGVGVTLAGSGARRFKMGTSVWWLTQGCNFDLSDVTALTNVGTDYASMTINVMDYPINLNAGGNSLDSDPTVVMGTVNILARTRSGQGLTYNMHKVNTLNIAGPAWLQNFSSDLTVGTLNITGSVNAFVLFERPVGADYSRVQLTVSTAANISYAIFRNMEFLSVTRTATNSINLGGNVGITFTPWSIGGGTSSTKIIGG